ncbi:MAG: SRPBCC domain-containing protein [Nitrospirae bacterium]|nr:SRPBCC domain-containing protein [Nitrospirota bacterium]
MKQDNMVLMVRRTINASAERLFDAWTKPELMKQWFRASEKMTTSAAEADLRVGGAWRVEMKMGTEISCPTNGQYKVIDRPNKLVFTWHPKQEADYETTVTLIFKKVSENVTDLTLTHEGLRNEEDKKGHTEGWEGCMSMLEKWAKTK